MTKEDALQIDELAEVSISEELAEAAEAFRAATEREPILKKLLLLNPIRAFLDAGIELSKQARKEIRRQYPEMNYEGGELYDKVQQGVLELPWIEEVRLGRPRGAEREVQEPIEIPEEAY